MTAKTVVLLLALLCSITHAQIAVESGTADARLEAEGYVRIPASNGGWFWGKPGTREETWAEAQARFAKEDQARGQNLVPINWNNRQSAQAVVHLQADCNSCGTQHLSGGT